MAQLAVLAVMAVSAMNKGAQERKLAYGEAAALRDASMRKMAATTAVVGEDQRTRDVNESRLIALAAFQGGGVDDPTIQTMIGDLNAEGEYRILANLYVGAQEAQGMQYASEQAMEAGDAAMDRGYLAAAKTVISAYGGGAFSGGSAPSVAAATSAGSGVSPSSMAYNPSSAASRYA